MGVNGVPFLLFSKDAVDFSQEIVGELNKDAPKEAAAAAAPAPATPAPAPAPAKKK